MAPPNKQLPGSVPWSLQTSCRDAQGGTVCHPAGATSDREASRQGAEEGLQNQSGSTIQVVGGISRATLSRFTAQRLCSDRSSRYIQEGIHGMANETRWRWTKWLWIVHDVVKGMKRVGSGWNDSALTSPQLIDAPTTITGINKMPQLSQSGFPCICEELGLTIQQSMRERIWKGEYIEMGHLLKEGSPTS